ncbi:MAG: rhomboid family intramembrane serine protease [Proteobacteria bacterium]|nr:rhomboid family intramembrane serine protease [Pseudomonadota bacterium]
MPFLRFAFPLVRPRRWDLVFVAVLLLAGVLWSDQLLGLDPGKLADEPWRVATWVLAQQGPLQAAGNGIGLAIGMTMAARCGGGWAAWTGMAGAILLPGIWSWYWMEPGELLVGASPVLYGALGMGAVSWVRVRHELTYARRKDWMAGFATLGLVALTLAIPMLADETVRGVHVIGFVWGGLVLALIPRDWDASATLGRGSLEQESTLDRTLP